MQKDWSDNLPTSPCRQEPIAPTQLRTLYFLGDHYYGWDGYHTCSLIDAAQVVPGCRRRFGNQMSGNGSTLGCQVRR